MSRKLGYDNRLIYQAKKEDDTYTGTNTEVANYIGTRADNLSTLCKRGYLVNGYKLDIIGVYKKIYNVIDDKTNEVIFSGTIDECANHFYLTESRIRGAAVDRSKILHQYRVVLKEVKLFKI